MDIASLVPAAFLQTKFQGFDAWPSLGIVLADSHQHANPAHSGWLLRVRDKRQGARNAAQQCDELPPLHCVSPPRTPVKLSIYTNGGAPDEG
jgi:hypothetical protein